MAKYKMKTKDRTLIVKVKLSFGEKINDREMDSFTRKYIRGLLKVKKLKKGCVEYIGPIAISLEDRLKNPISKHDFYLIIEQIVDTTQKLDLNEMNMDYITFDMKSVYINETTKEMQFIYLPLAQVEKKADVLGFIENIIYSVVPMQDDDDYISKFIYFIKGMKGYNAAAIEKYIIKEDVGIVNMIKRHYTGQSGFMTDKPSHYYSHYANETDEETALLDDEATTLLNDEATGLLDDESTEMLQADLQIHYPSLYRISTGERIEINKPVFRIGKERSYSDYFVANNDKVSRSHADIIIRNNKYFIIDLNSRNRTFINDQAIPVQQETEIFSGDTIRLANEEFVFQV